MNSSECRRCSECIGEEHHWMTDLPSCPELEPEHPAALEGLACWVECKHCEAYKSFELEEFGVDLVPIEGAEA